MRLVLALIAAMLPVGATAQSDGNEAWRWCERLDSTIPLDRAIAGCSAVIGSGQADARDLAIAYVNRGVWRLDQGDRAGAMADYTAAIDADPRNADAHAARGFMRADQGERAGAIADYTAAIDIDPRDGDAIFNRGILRGELGDRAGAMADYTAAIEIDPLRADVYNNRGNLHRAAGDLAGAIADYTEALRHDPREPYALANRCIARHRLHEANAAREDCAAAITAAQPGEGWPHAAGAGLALLRDDLPAAALDLSEALRRDPVNAYALQLRSLLRARQGDGAGSAADAASARARLPRIAEIIVETFGPDLVR